MPQFRQVSANIDWAAFQQADVILPICVRSPNVQGRNFMAMLDALKGRVHSVHLVLCDYLDRHNLDGDGDLALAQSVAWQQANMAEVYKRFASVTVTDWQAIMRDPTFEARHETLKNLYLNNNNVRKAIDVNVDIYVREKIKRLVSEGEWGYDPDLIEQQSRAYLIEEYAGTAIYKYVTPSLTQVYWGVYIDDIDVFTREVSGVDLTLPKTLAVTNSRLGASIVSIQDPMRYQKVA